MRKLVTKARTPMPPRRPGGSRVLEPEAPSAAAPQTETTTTSPANAVRRPRAEKEGR